MICHRRRDSEAAGEASPGFHLARLVLQASQSIPQPPLQNPFLLCCRAELAFSGAVSLQEGPGTGGDTHTHSAGCFLNPHCRNRSSSGPIGVPLHLRSCGITSPPRDPPMHRKFQDRASKTISYPQGSFYTQNATQTTSEVDILPPPLLTSVPPAEPI